MIEEERKTMGEKECPSCGADNDNSKSSEQETLRSKYMVKWNGQSL